MSDPICRYWDSTNFISLIAEDEPTRADTCQRVLEDADQGNCRIIISALTIAEVIKPKGQPVLAEDAETTVSNFFLHDYILVYDLTRAIAEKCSEAGPPAWAQTQRCDSPGNGNGGRCRRV